MKSGYFKIVQTLQTSFILIFVSLYPLSGLCQREKRYTEDRRV